jgi:hypothetical protein
LPDALPQLRTFGVAPASGSGFEIEPYSLYGGLYIFVPVFNPLPSNDLGFLIFIVGQRPVLELPQHFFCLGDFIRNAARRFNFSGLVFFVQ